MRYEKTLRHFVDTRDCGASGSRNPEASRSRNLTKCYMAMNKFITFAPRKSMIRRCKASQELCAICSNNVTDTRIKLDVSFRELY